MKTKNILILSIFMVLAFLLSSCSGAMAASSWPGISGDEESVYVSYATRVYSLRLKDGSLNWRYPEKVEAAQTFFAPPLMVDDQLIVGSYNKVLFSINSKSGTVNWLFNGAKNRYIGSAGLVDSKILAPNADHNLYALDLNGNLQWTFETDQALWSQPLNDGTQIYLAAMDHNIYALNYETGQKIWETDLGGAMLYSPELNSDRLFVSTLNSEVVAVDLSNGQVLWRNAVDNGIWSQPVFNDGVVYYGDSLGRIYAVSAEDGSIVWDYNFAENVVGTAAVMPEGIVFAGENGKLAALDFNGELLWNRSVSGKLYTGPVVVQDTLVLGIVGGEELVKAYNFEGTEIWSFTPEK